MKKNEKVSVIILGYKKYDYIYETIKSVFDQTYPLLELIISDDGSGCLPKEKIKTFISKNKTSNIKNILIREEKKNVGTVKHLNHNIDISSGDFLCFLGADDQFYDKNVIMKYVNGFNKTKSNCCIQFAQTAMYDETLTKFDYYFLQSNVQKAMMKHGKELFYLLLEYPWLPSTSTFFKKEFFDHYGKFDEKYILIEDYPMHLKIARKEVDICFQNFIAVKHRHGGVSHGAVNEQSKSLYLYRKDMYNLIKQEIYPYLKLLPNDKYKEVKKERDIELDWLYWEIFKYENNNNNYQYNLHHKGTWLKNFFIQFYYRNISKIEKIIKFNIIMGIGIFSLDKMLITLNFYKYTLTKKLDYALLLLLSFSLFYLVLLIFSVIIGKFLISLERFPNEDTIIR